MSKNYVKIWENYHNKKLEKGLEIHHIDGDRTNNDPENLIAVTIQEHLDIHLKQLDYGAVQAILMRMQKTKDDHELLKTCASLNQTKLWKENKHNFQKLSLDEKKRVSREVGIKTRDAKIGIHAINSDPILARSNAKHARSKLDREKELEMMRAWRDKVKDSKWWNNGVVNKRSKEKPGPDFIEGMKK